MGYLVGRAFLVQQKITSPGRQSKSQTKGREFSRLGSPHNGQQIDLPGRTRFIKIEQVKPGDCLRRLGQDMIEAAINLQVRLQFRPEKLEEFEFGQPVDRRQRVFFRKNQPQFRKKPGIIGLAKELHLDRALDQAAGMGVDFEIHALFKTDGPKDTGGIFDKA